jgi:outer membrane lipoprotein-sorting protein
MVVLLLGACGGSAPETPKTNTSTATVTPAGPSPSPLTDFEEALRFVRNGQYTYIYVISRKDGKPIQPDDNSFLKTNAPQVVDWAATKDKTKVVAGTNFNLEEGNLEMLKKRFVVEDYSAK